MKPDELAAKLARLRAEAAKQDKVVHTTSTEQKGQSRKPKRKRTKR